MLKAMRRNATRKLQEQLITKLKKKIPIGKKNFDKQKQVLEIYEQKLANK
jgi:molybdopterin synthase catalytic subunit